MGSVSAIPSGHHTVTPHLVIRGASDAIDFYIKAFGATDVTRMDGPDGKILHAEIKIGDSYVYLAEEAPGWGILSPLSLNGTAVVIHLYTEDANAWFQRALEAGATTVMPLSDMFWGDRWGKLADPFGHHWSVAQRLEILTHDQLVERTAKAMSQSADCPSPDAVAV